MPKLSAIIITRNEERNLEACLSALLWVDEIILVDAGSTDRTLEIAQKYTEKVYERPWSGYGQAKNYALDQAAGDWILWIDADERVTPELHSEILVALAGATDRTGAFSFPRKANFLGKWIMHCGWYPGRVTRLFRKLGAKFTEDRVHEQLVVSGNIEHLKSDLLHFTDPNLSHYFEKFNRYTSLAAEDMLGERHTFVLSHVLIRPVWVFIKMYIVRLGFLDGIPGLILCTLSRSE
jgi:glycosyltransferase involved in cell wall biosynthesis